MKLDVSMTACVMFYHVLVPCIFFRRCQRFGKTQSPSLPWRRRQYVSPNHWHLPTSLHGVKTRNNKIIIDTCCLCINGGAWFSQECQPNSRVGGAAEIFGNWAYTPYSSLFYDAESQVRWRQMLTVEITPLKSREMWYSAVRQSQHLDNSEC
jgi:hypothetical protein